MFAPTLLGLLMSSIALVSAAPSMKRVVGPGCGNLGAGAFDVVTNFTLAAYYADQPNANNTGAPIVLGQAGAIDGAEFKVLSVRIQHPFDLTSPTLTIRRLSHHSHSTTTLLFPCKTGPFSLIAQMV